MSTENENHESTPVEEVPAQNTSEVVEVEWEKVASLYEKNARIAQLEEALSNMMLQFEKRKLSFLDNIVQSQNSLYEEASEVRNSLEIPQTEAYELKLPTAPGEKAYFIRKP